MSVSIDTSHSKAVLIGAGSFPKDTKLLPIATAGYNLSNVERIFKTPNAFNLAPANVISSFDEPDSVAVKEKLASFAELTNGVLFFYYTGKVVIRKGAIYLAMNSSTKQQIHVNGLPLQEVMAILGESDAVLKCLVFDVQFVKANNDISPDDAEFLRSEFEKIEEINPNTLIISTLPKDATTENAFSNRFSQAFLKVLTEGLTLEEEFLCINQIYDGIVEQAKVTKGFEKPYRGKKSNLSEKKIAINKKYVEFSKVYFEGEALFDEGQFAQAKIAYQKAKEYFADHKGVTEKLTVIDFVVKGDELFEEGKFDEAISAFKSGYAVYESSLLADRVFKAQESLADMLYGQADFEQARFVYEELIELNPDNELFKDRLEKSKSEISFFNLVDEGDKFYFEDKYEEAYAKYVKALEIRYDLKTNRRKVECERLLEKEQLLRDKIKDDIRKELEEEYRAELEEKFASEQPTEAPVAEPVVDKASLEKDLTEELNRKMEVSVWARISLKNEIEGYNLYLELFPAGEYSSKAKQRIQELEQKEAEVQAAAQAAIEAARAKTKEVEAVAEKTESPVVETPVEKVEVQQEPPAIETIEEEAPAVEQTSEQSSAASDTVEEKQSDEGRIKLADKIQIVKEAGEGLSDEDYEALKEKPYTAESTNDITAEPELVTEESTDSKEESVVAEVPKEPKEDLSHLSEEDLWNRAVSAATAKAYMEYVDNTREAGHVVDAYYMINKLSKEEGDSSGEAPENAADSVIDEINSFAATKVNGYDDAEPLSGFDSADSLKKKFADEQAANGNPISTEPSVPEQESKIEVEEETQEPVIETPEEVSVAPVMDEEPAVVETPVKETVAETSIEQVIATRQKEDTSSQTAEEYDDKLWSEAIEENTLSAYYNYINNTTAKKYWEEAKERIKALKEEARKSEEDDWQTAKELDSLESYKGYVRKYPLGNYYAKAMFRINELTD